MGIPCNRTRDGRAAIACLLVALLATCLSPGCGYRFATTGEPVGIRLDSLAIPLIKSTSSQPGFEADFTKILRQEFISHGRVPLLGEDRAQAVLQGRVQEIITEPLTYSYQDATVKGYDTTYELTRSRRLRIRLDVRLVNRADGKVIWQEPAMEEKASFDVGTDPLANRYHQQQALDKIARRLAARIYLKTMERF
ncbi:MAG: hypothetical protein JW821_18530 [Deltaproteobacteria bacterium]|nr:hypothetical protein [Deltaproteobacteria bacterium]